MKNLLTATALTLLMPLCAHASTVIQVSEPGMLGLMAAGIVAALIVKRRRK